MRKILLLMIIVLLSGCNDSNGGPNQEVNRNDGSSVVTTQTEGYNEIVGGIDLVMEEAFAIPGAIIRE